MKRFLIVAFCVACLWAQPGQAQALRSIDDLRDITRQAMTQVEIGNFAEVFATMAPHWPFSVSELDMLSMQTMTQRSTLGQRFGLTMGIDLASEQIVGDSIMRITYIEKLEYRLIRWVFTFYKADDEWMVNAIVWDDDIDALF
ncbi:MAG: hypothetical protein VCD33_08945 [Alphaproteobacteria bacterium]